MYIGYIYVNPSIQVSKSMDLSLAEASEKLGKTQRQLRYLIQKGELAAKKENGRWLIPEVALF